MDLKMLGKFKPSAAFEHLHKTVFIVLVVITCLLLGGSRTPSLLEKIQAQGTLLVISRNGPTTYYEGASGYTGFEYSLTRAFAKRMGLKLEIIEEGSLKDLLTSVGGKAQLAAAGLTITPEREEQVAFTRPYMFVTQQVIYRTTEARPESVANLIGKSILVVKNSSHAERLRELQTEYPELKWEERDDIEALDLMEMVHKKKIDYAIVDSNVYDVNANLYPKAKVAFDISTPQPIAWAFPKYGDQSLLQAANQFLATLELSGGLSDIIDRYFSGAKPMGESDADAFARHIDELLPKWKDSLRTAADEHDLDWLLLAALSYQESRWNPTAKSPTGVRGFMMLTKITAKEVGIADRLNPQQSIQGGAKYFRGLLDRVPESIQGEERIWFALAAYNIGFGHLEDARELTLSHGGNPDRWEDVKLHLPLLTKRQYYKATKHGYARGREAVRYVSKVRTFYNILGSKDPEQQEAVTAQEQPLSQSPTAPLSKST
jgi:membrane-bound lytic murein transglycosylase F